MDKITEIEKLLGIQLFPFQRKLLEIFANTSKDQVIYLNMPRWSGRTVLLEAAREVLNANNTHS